MLLIWKCGIECDLICDEVCKWIFYLEYDDKEEGLLYLWGVVKGELGGVI